MLSRSATTFALCLHLLAVVMREDADTRGSAAAVANGRGKPDIGIKTARYCGG